jgi:hypothetical protein
MKASLCGSWLALVGAALLFAVPAFAEGEACYVDTDCPGTACGDAVCNWAKTTTMPMDRKIFYCNPAGTDAKGKDGWCETDDDCKCKGVGATCVGTYCTFTKPSDAPGGGGSAAGGSASTAGTSSSTTAGTASSAAGSSSSSKKDDGGGCSVYAPGRTNEGLAALALLGLGLGLVFRRHSSHDARP